MTAWAVTSLRAKLPDAKIVWAVQERCAPVIDTKTLVNTLHTFPREKWKSNRWSPMTWRDQVVKYTSLRNEKFDVGFDFQGHSKTALCMKLAGCKERFASKATDAFAKLLTSPKESYRFDLHEVQNAINLVNQRFSVDLALHCTMPNYPNGDFGCYDVIIQTGAGEKDKIYPASKWEEVVQSLSIRGLRIATIGGASDPNLMVDNHSSLVGKLSLEQCIEVIRKSKLHVSGDTGTAHIAAALAVPTVTLFSRTDPLRFQPWGAHSAVIRDVTGMENIDPQKVSEEIINGLKESCAVSH